MNVVFISPHFPLYFHNFCSRLKQRNVNVLGIIDTDYQNISQETKNSLTDCYCVNSLDNYDEVYRAVAYFISKYGRIDCRCAGKVSLGRGDGRLAAKISFC